jgi:hypothetical protein
MTVKFDVSKSEAKMISRIAKRAVTLAASHGHTWEFQDTEMDITAVHANGCPLDLSKLDAFDSFNLLHDIAGIRQHLNRQTGKLENCFVPRCAQPG